jgi:hypothetical protein
MFHCDIHRFSHTGVFIITRTPIEPITVASRLKFSRLFFKISSIDFHLSRLVAQGVCLRWSFGYSGLGHLRFGYPNRL